MIPDWVWVAGALLMIGCGVIVLAISAHWVYQAVKRF